jgi:hypothetical protein
MSLTDTQIKDLCYRMDIPLGGVFFKNELKKLDYNKAYFVNMQDSVDETGQINPGTHWVYLQVQKTPNGQINPIYFDPYGQPAPEDVKKKVKKLTNRDNLPYTKKDVQSLMNNACGFYCLAFGHFINASQYRSGNFYDDVDKFLDMFDDLNHNVDFKKNEYILLHFFRSKDPKLRKEIDNIKPIDSIQNESEKGGLDMMRIPVDIKYMDKN